MDFIIEKKTTKFITSVCTSSLILGEAGLLKGYKPTLHWATLDVLKEFGAIPTEARIVEDRKIITGGGGITQHLLSNIFYPKLLH